MRSIGKKTLGVCESWKNGSDLIRVVKDGFLLRGSKLIFEVWVGNI